MSEREEREAFEKWARDRGYRYDELSRCTTGIVSPEYYNLNTENAWQAWQARASQPALAQGDEPVIDIAFIEQVGDRIGYQSSAWDCVDAAELIKAVIATYHEEKTLSARREQPQCETCNDVGMVGGLLPGDGGYQSDPCPDCAEQPQGVVVPKAIGGGVLLQAARELVEALDQTHWSSWQTTANFQEPLDKLRALLGQREG